MPRQLALLLLVLASTGLTACGDGDDGGSEGDGLARQEPVPADALLSRVRPTGTGPQEVDTRVEARLEGTASGPVAAFVDVPLELRVTGRGDTADGAADLRLALDAGVLKMEGRYVADGERDYAQVLDEWYVLPENASGVFSAVTPALLSRPDALLAGGAQVVGTESVDGVECDVVEGPAEPDAVAERLAGVIGVVPVVGDAAGLEAAALRGAVQAGTARVWIGRDDGEVHRVSVDATVDLADTPLGEQGLTGGEVTLDGRAVDADGPVEVTAPAGARPIAELPDRLGGLVPQGAGP